MKWGLEYKRGYYGSEVGKKGMGWGEEEVQSVRAKTWRGGSLSMCEVECMEVIQFGSEQCRGVVEEI